MKYQNVLRTTAESYQKKRYFKFNSDHNREELTKSLKVMANMDEGDHWISEFATLKLGVRDYRQWVPPKREINSFGTLISRNCGEEVPKG